MTMFSREDANRLRESLRPMVFKGATPRTPLLQAYCDFYGLSFDNSLRPTSHSIGSFDCDAFTIVCQHFQVPLAQQRGTVFLLHGYFDHVGLYSHAIEHCLSAGFSVVAFDLPGHGLSSGIPASISSFRQYVTALLACLTLAQQQQVHAPWVIIGQSTGGAVIIDALQQEQLASRFSFAAYVVLAPLLRPQHWHRSKLLFWMTRWFLRATPRSFARNSHDVEFLNFIQHSDALQSRLLQRDWVQAMMEFQQRFARSPQSSQMLQIIQGSGDGTVDWQYNVPEIVAKFPQSRFHMIRGAGHHLVNEAQPYRDRVFALLDEILNAAAT